MSMRKRRNRRDFGGLIASGWHTCSALMRMNVDHWLLQTTGIAGVGVEDNRWLAPVRPGDRLCAEMETLEKIDLRSRPDAGIVKFAISLRNQTGQEVMAQKCSMLFGRRRTFSTSTDEAARGKPRKAAGAGFARRASTIRWAPFPTITRGRASARYAELGETVFTPRLHPRLRRKIRSAFPSISTTAWRTRICSGVCQRQACMSPAAGWGI